MKKKVLNGFSTKFLDSDEGNKLYSQIPPILSVCFTPDKSLSIPFSYFSKHE